MTEITDAAPPLVNCWTRIGVWSRGGERCPELGRVVHCRNCPVYSAAGRRFLDRPLEDDCQQEWTVALAREKVVKDLKARSAFVFRVGREWLALAATLIREVVPMGPIHSLPHRRSAILRGVVNIRGKLEICVSIGGVLGIDKESTGSGESGYAAPERMIVAARRGETFVFPVSQVRGMARYHAEMLRNLPVTVTAAKAAYTTGILSLDGRDVGFLDEEALFRAINDSLT
ncbi:MAG: chemotaxis protein CheW [Thermodesulfobacteriota bacterium]